MTHCRFKMRRPLLLLVFFVLKLDSELLFYLIGNLCQEDCNGRFANESELLDFDAEEIIFSQPNRRNVVPITCAHHVVPFPDDSVHLFFILFRSKLALYDLVH